MSNNKQSSVEWFAKESWKLRVELEDEKISLGEYANKYYQLKQQAKAMHKEEIKEAHERGQSDEKDYWNIGDKVGVRFMVKSKEYYNETFEE